MSFPALPRERLPLLAFPKIAPSSLSNRRVHSQVGLLLPFAIGPLRLLDVPTVWFYATSPACSSSILSALLQRLTTLGFIVRFTGLRRIPAMSVLPFEAFPPPMAVVAERRFPRCHHLGLRARAGRLSPPARLSPCSAALHPSSFTCCQVLTAVLFALKPDISIVPKDP